MNPKKTLVAAAVLSGSCLLVPAQNAAPQPGSPDADAARSTISKWIETQQIIIKERKEWQEGREILQSRIAVLEQELASLEGRLDESLSGTRETDQKEMELARDNRQLEERAAVLASFVGEQEAAIKALHASLPVPVQEKLEPLYQRIPADPGSTRSPAATGAGRARRADTNASAAAKRWLATTTPSTTVAVRSCSSLSSISSRYRSRRSSTPVQFHSMVVG